MPARTFRGIFFDAGARACGSGSDRKSFGIDRVRRALATAINPLAPACETVDALLRLFPWRKFFFPATWFDVVQFWDVARAAQASAI